MKNSYKSFCFFMVSILFSSFLLSGCYYPNNKWALDLGRERAEKHLTDPKFSNVFVVEEPGSTEDVFHSYVCGYADFKDMYGNYNGFPLRFFVKARVIKNQSGTEVGTSNFTLEPLSDNEWFEKQWVTNCKTSK